MKSANQRSHSLFRVVFLTFAISFGANAADPATADQGAADETGKVPEKVDVQTMKRRYWTVGNEDMMNVVQNRLYTKKNRAEAVLSYGFYSDDPFMSMNSVSLRLGYHLNEMWSVHAFYAAVQSKQSGAYEASRRDSGVDPVVNPPVSLYGGEARFSVIYGKLSLLGKSIIYYDLNLAAGVARIHTRVDDPMAFTGGIGQQIFISKSFFLTTDYRLMYHSEKYGSATGSRTLWTNWIQIGVGTFVF